MSDSPAPVASDLLSLEGKLVFITGGASGMGRASSELLAAHGAHVVIVDRDEAAGIDTVSSIQGAGGSAESHVLDVGADGALETFVGSFDHDVVDVMFNHAGLPGPPGMEFDAASWQYCMAVNVWAPMELTKLLLPRLRRSPSASLIFTASTAGLRAVPGLLTYAASKGALVQYVKSLAVLLAPEGIRANAICPGATDTPALRRDLVDGTLSITLEQITSQIPLRRLGVASDVANLALFLASEASAYVTGLAIAVDGGATA